MNSIRSEQIRDGEVRREDIDITTSGQALITKVIAGKAITFANSTGIDAGTGDVTLDFGDSTDLFYDDINKRIGLGTGTPGSTIDIILPSSTSIGQTIKAAAAQTANLIEFKNSSGTIKAHVNAAGDFNNTGGGTDSLILGAGANVDSDEPRSVSVGTNASSFGDDSVAIGYNSIAGSSANITYRYCVAIGSGASADLSNCVAIGYNADAGGTSAGTAIGASSVLTGNNAVAIGQGTSAGVFGVAIGQGTSNAGSGISIGKDATGSFALGYNANSVGHSSAMAMGTSATATQLYSIAIGQSASSTHGGSICIGQSATSTANRQLVIGSDSLNAAEITDVYIGKGVVDATPTSTTYHATGGEGTNIAGANILIASGKGTGNANSGEIIFQTSDSGASGTSLQSLSTKLKIDKDGQLVTALDPNVGSYFATSTNKLGLEATNEIWLNTPKIYHPQALTYQMNGALTYSAGNANVVFTHTNSSITYGNYNAQFSGNRIRMADSLSGNTSNDETAKFDIFNYTGTSTVSGTIAELYTSRIGKQTLTNATTATTFTIASTLQIEDAPVASTNVTITEALALYVKAGNVKFNDDLHLKTGNIKFDSNKTKGAGVATLTASLYYVDVTFDNAMDSTDYVVNVDVEFQTSVWISNRTTSGFRVNTGSTSTYDEPIRWSIRPY